MNEFLEQFLIECRELVQAATGDLLALEASPQDKALIDGVFRAFHTLKGAAGIVEFPAMGHVLHAVEDVLAAVRSGRRAVTGATGLGGFGRVAFCGWTGFGLRSMYVFMVSVFLSSVVWGVRPTTCGSAPFTRCNPRLLRRADTLYHF